MSSNKDLLLILSESSAQNEIFIAFYVNLCLNAFYVNCCLNAFYSKCYINIFFNEKNLFPYSYKYDVYY